MNDKNVNTIRAYNFGGLGFNIGAQLETFRDHAIKATAQLDIAYADTSDSDMQAEIDVANCFFLPGAAGSGKFQGQHLDAIDAHAKAFLQNFKPSETLNIVVSSASGGSGPAFASTIVSELLDAGKNVIVIVVGTTADKREITNTRNNVRSYINIAEDTDKPVPIAYFQNSTATPRAAVDKAIVALVGSLCVLFSGQNHGLDKQDLYNWLHFNENKTTSYGARIAQLSMFEGDDHIGNIGNVITVATLSSQKSGHEIEQTPEYQVVGRIPEDATQVIIEATPIHFVISTGRFAEVLKSLDDKLVEINRAREAVVDTLSSNMGDAKAKANKRGIVVD